MDGNFLTDRPKCGLCMHWIGFKCTNPMRHPSHVNSIDDCCILFTPADNIEFLKIKDFIEVYDTSHDDSLVCKPNYKENKPTYESGYLISKFGKM